jgi:hypothetical protein
LFLIIHIIFLPADPRSLVFSIKMAPGILVDGATSSNYSSKAPSLLSKVVHHKLITEEFDALRFHAAASLQLLSPLTPGGSPLLDSKVITSPYNDPDHVLDLDTLSIQDKILTLALTTMQPILDNYATEDYEVSFNWDVIFATVRALAASANHTWTKQEFYVVIFRSQLKEGCDRQLLHDLDKHSHREATVSGGLLKYWFGSCNEDRRNLATCKSNPLSFQYHRMMHISVHLSISYIFNLAISVSYSSSGIWRNREDARAGGTGPWHFKARLAARTLYDYIKFTTWKLTVDDGATAWTIQPSSQ